ncbi:hypothetical protein V8324_10205 [Roseovarius sp. D22-M7]
MKITGHVSYEFGNFTGWLKLPRRGIGSGYPRGTSLHEVIGEFAVEDRMARRMFSQFADLFPGVVTNDDDDRRRWCTLSS